MSRDPVIRNREDEIERLNLALVRATVYGTMLRRNSPSRQIISGRAASSASGRAVREMTRAETMPRAAIRLTFLLATALGAVASTSARPGDLSDLDANTPRQAGTPSGRSRPDSAAASAPMGAKPGEPGPAVPEHAPGANPLWAIPLTTLSTTRERPIFSPSRRPPPPVAAPVTVAKAPPQPPPARVERAQLSLLGTVIGDEQRIGIFVDPSTRATLRLRIGEAYQGWTLSLVEAREVTLERDHETTRLSLPAPGTGATRPVQAENPVVAVSGDPPPQHGDRH